MMRLICSLCLLLPIPALADSWEYFIETRAKLAALVENPKAKAATMNPLFRDGFEPCPSGVDSDADGLDDCVETATGQYLSPEDTGTDPFVADTDEDGIRDGDEVHGTPSGLDLPSLGVSPLRRDLLIEIDWFEDGMHCGSHSHQPSPAVVSMVEQAFASLPLENPDGSFGVNAILDYGQLGALSGGNRIMGYPADLPGAFDATYNAIKAGNFSPNRRGYFRYVLFPHRYNNGSTSSGYAEVVGDDAIVSMGCYQNEKGIANTILHEVGHLLGLHHGGFEACNGKPNYNSIMNYRYQFDGPNSDCTHIPGSDGSFSLGERLALDENDLNEFEGVCGAPAIDWDGDGQMEASVREDINPNDNISCGSTYKVLEDFPDAQFMTFLGILDAHGKLAGIKTSTHCPSY